MQWALGPGDINVSYVVAAWLEYTHSPFHTSITSLNASVKGFDKLDIKKIYQHISNNVNLSIFK